MKQIKQFFKSLEKEGLLWARLTCRDREYKFSRQEGIQEKILEKPARPLSKGEKKKAEIRVLSRIVFVLIGVVVILLVLFVFLNRKTVQTESEPSRVSGPLETLKKEIDPVKEIPIQAEKENSQKPDEFVTEKTDKPVNKKEKENNSRLVISPEKQPVDGKKTEGSKTQIKTETTGPPPYRGSVSIREISEKLIQEYNQQVKIIRMDLPRRVKVSGYVNINLFINEIGEVFLFQMNETGLNIKPDSKKKRVILKLKLTISALRFKLPKDKYGRPVKVENWRLNYQVTQFKKRMILRKQ
ncbi:MAG: hypothetical protein KAT17_08055 [Candidatus Aminicenantes bacterium]|nr:hypothetical protein [Candidatus Aminicenantes bacterium]